MTTILQPSDMHPDFFVTANRKIKPVTTMRTFVAELTNTARADQRNLGSPTTRRTLYLANNGFGYVHLDFYARNVDASGNNFVFRLPADSPTPVGLLETQTHDGGTVWIAANSREVRFAGLTVGQRYIVDVQGFWNV